MKYLLFTCTYSLRAFFHGSGRFSFIDPDFWSIRIRQKAQSGSGKKDPDPKHCITIKCAYRNDFLLIFNIEDNSNKLLYRLVTA